LDCWKNKNPPPPKEATGFRATTLLRFAVLLNLRVTEEQRIISMPMTAAAVKTCSCGGQPYRSRASFRNPPTASHRCGSSLNGMFPYYSRSKRFAM